MYGLALQLGCFVSDILNRMSLAEYQGWLAFFASRNRSS